MSAAALASGIASASTQVRQNLLKVTRQDNFIEWYRGVLDAADLAEPSAVRGCMVIKPWGYGIWEQIQRQMDDLFKKEKCCKNAYFPLFIPVEFFEKEASHVAGFAKECAVVTHYRMKLLDGKMIPDPDAVLARPLIVRPTSETIIGDSMRQWIQSHRDLPMLLNQWANVVRWEHETKPFLRTTEFLWQEGHCAFANEKQARADTIRMGQVYNAFMTKWCALPVLMGEKTPSERFAGADQTICLEAMMQDGKAVQAGTSHYLGTHFSQAADIMFTDTDAQRKHAHTTSWGVSTRLVGTIIMAHSDDDGLRLPPRMSPAHIVIIPSGYKDFDKRDPYIERVEKAFEGVRYAGRDVTIEVDTKDVNAGEKKYEWIKKGVPIRLEIGAREATNGNVTLFRRDQDHQKALLVKFDDLTTQVVKILDEIQNNYFGQAQRFLQSNISTDVTTYDQLVAHFTTENKIGWVRAKWAGDEDAQKAEEKFKDDYKVTIRCILSDQSGTEGTCVLTGKPAKLDVIFGRSY